MNKEIVTGFLLTAGASFLIAAGVVRLANGGEEETAPQINLHLYIDPEQGCHYFLSEKGGIFPRLAADGLPHCVPPGGYHDGGDGEPVLPSVPLTPPDMRA